MPNSLSRRHGHILRPDGTLNTKFRCDLSVIFLKFDRNCICKNSTLPILLLVLLHPSISFVEDKFPPNLEDFDLFFDRDLLEYLSIDSGKFQPFIWMSFVNIKRGDFWRKV